MDWHCYQLAVSTCFIGGWIVESNQLFLTFTCVHVYYLTATDGGRVALALFGRGSKPFIGNIMLSTIFLIGVLGSDLFLFYFSFLIAFQTGNEIPARNEVDDISFSRVLVATAGSVLALLTLIPFQ